MTEALIYTLTDTLAEVEAETLSDTLADVKAEAQFHALVDTVAEVEAETLYETLSDMKDKTLVEALHETLAKYAGRRNWCHTGRSGNQGTARHAGLNPSLGGARGTSGRGGCHASISERRNAWRQ